MPAGSSNRDRPAPAVHRRILAACHTDVTPRLARSANDLNPAHDQAVASRCHDLAEETPASDLAETNGVRLVFHTVTAASPNDPDGQGVVPALRPVHGEGSHVPAGPSQRRNGHRPGSLLIAVATGLLFLLGVGLFAVSLDAQYRYVFHAKHQSAASWIEALALDVGMVIFSLLALGLARAGKPARVERVLITACAAASGVMNFAAANDTSLKSVLAYVMPPVFLAVVADRVVSVVRRHALGEDEQSPWLAAGTAVLYTLRLALALPSTAAGLRRWLLLKTPLPAATAPSVAPAPERKAIGGRRGPAGRRAESKTARFLALVAERHGPLAGFPPEHVSRTCTELAPEVGLDVGAARTALRRAVLAAQDGRQAK
jgi:hypothetical protein